MASIVVTMVDTKYGVHNVSYEITDADMERMYKAYKYLYMGEDVYDEARQVPGNASQFRANPLSIDQQNAREIVYKLSHKFITDAFSGVTEIETQVAIKNMNINPIEVLEVK